MKLPTSKKGVHRLNSILTDLNRFISNYAQHTFYKLLKKKTDFKWITDCKEVFKSLKKTLATLPILSRPSPGEVLYLYLVITEEDVSVILIRESDIHQRLM